MEEILQEIGLSGCESKVYIACLKIGSSTVNTIAKEAGTYRTYTYDILDSLIKKGFVGSIIKDKKTYYEAIDPERIIEILKEREYRVKKILPRLKSIQESVNKKPAVQVYEGISGLNAIHDMILREAPKEIRIYGNPEKHYDVMKFYLPRFVNERVKKNIYARIILKDSKIAREWMKGKEKEELRKTRFFPKQPKSFPAITYLWNDKTVFFTINKKIIVVVITDGSIASINNTIFENLWEIAKNS